VTESDVTVSLWTNGPSDDLITADDINYWQPPRTPDPNDSLLTQYRDLGANTDNLAPTWLTISGINLPWTTNIGTGAVFAVSLLPSETGSVEVTVGSSNTTLVPQDPAYLAICSDAEGTPLVNPITVAEAGVVVTVYLMVTPADDTAGSTTLTVTVNDTESAANASEDFDLTVELADATINDLADTTAQDPYLLSGQKGKNSSIWLQWLDAAQHPVGDPVEIVPPDEETTWIYGLDLEEGVNRFSLETRAGSFSETILPPTSVTLDTTPPAKLPVIEMTALSWPASNNGNTVFYPVYHDIEAVVTRDPADTDSVDYRRRLDGADYTGFVYNFGEPYWLENLSVDDPHVLAVAGRDSQGNIDDQRAAAVLWTFTVDDTLVSEVDIAKAAGNVDLSWEAAPGSGFTLRSRQTDIAPWEDLGASVTEGPAGVYTCTVASAGGGIESYRLTDPSGETVFFTLDLGYSRLPLPGDIDGSGAVDLADAVLALQAAADLATGADIALKADVDGDGRIGVIDAVFALQRTAQVRGL
jgi:hypothetical protein